MAEDARFEDGAERPLYLKAFDGEELLVISALVQDAVLAGGDMKWEPKARRLSFLINRFRWEDRGLSSGRSGRFERVRALLIFRDVLSVASQGLRQAEHDTVLSVLSIGWIAGEDGTGRVEIILAGDGTIAAEVECLDVTLKDVTRPYLAPSGKKPEHPA
ncbi:MAG: DUF2948 family protein [Rhodobacteraceae bacterium]|nr:DUF2948 family protein [Paracoccaceae bacterium]MCP5341171.1 DUF2948 family protein [Paracoccaceae bacterium]